MSVGNMVVSFQYEGYDDEIILTRTGEDLNIHQIAEAFSKFLLAVGYHPNNISEVIKYNEEML